MKIINALTLGEMCEAALDGEPVFILRAKDNLAPQILQVYEDTAINSKATNLARIRAAITRFREWRTANPGKCKLPD